MKNKMFGWQKVYGFAMKQRLKGKGFRITISVMFLIALLSMPVMSLIGNSGGDKDKAKSKVSTLYVNDHEAGLTNAIKTVLKESDIYSGVKVESVSNDSKIKDMENNKSDDVYVEINVSYGVHYSGYYGISDNISKNNAEKLIKYVKDHSKEILMYSNNMNAETVKSLTKDYTYEVVQLAEGTNGMEIQENKEGLGLSEYGFSYALLMVSLLLIMIGSSSVADAIVTEKSTRVIEYLLINLKPMAIVLGKILAAVTTIIIELLSVVVGLIGSVIINGFMFPNSDGSIALPQMVESFLNGQLFAKASPLGIVIAVLVFLLGVVFYGFVAGIAGASVSRVEDTQEGMKLFTMVAIIGAYLALFLIISESSFGSNFGALTNVVYLLPLSSPFIIPEYLILGKVSVAMGAASLAIMIVSIVLLLILVSNIYGALIYHRGAPLKLKDIIGLSKSERGHK